MEGSFKHKNIKTYRDKGVLSVASRYSCYPNNDEVVAFLSLLIQIFLINKEREKQIKTYAFMLCS